MSSSVQPKTKIGTNAQYAMAMSHDICTNEQSQIENVFSREEAEYVKDIITEGKTCVLCSASSNVIATRPNVVTGENSEHILLFPPGNSPMDTLLNNTDQNNCVAILTTHFVWKRALRALTIFFWALQTGQMFEKREWMFLSLESSGSMSGKKLATIS